MHCAHCNGHHKYCLYSSLIIVSRIFLRVVCQLFLSLCLSIKSRDMCIVWMNGANLRWAIWTGGYGMKTSCAIGRRWWCYFNRSLNATGRRSLSLRRRRHCCCLVCYTTHNTHTYRIVFFVINNCGFCLWLRKRFFFITLDNFRSLDYKSSLNRKSLCLFRVLDRLEMERHRK